MSDHQQVKKFYRIIEDQNASAKQQQDSSSALINALSSISSGIKYIYIDINEDKGFKMMQKCEGFEPDQDIEQVGGSYISNLQYSSENNRKGIAYILKLKQIDKQKKAACHLFDQQIQRSRLQLRKNKAIMFDQFIANSKKSHKIHLYRGMDPKILEACRQSQEFDSIDQEIKQRQKKLLHHYPLLTEVSNQNISRNPSKAKTHQKRSLSPIPHNSLGFLNI